MISDSSNLGDKTVDVMNQLMTDNDIPPDRPTNSFNTTVNAFPYLEVLASLNARISKLEKE